MKLLTNKKAVSEIVGYLLTLTITASVVSVTLVVTSTTIDDKASNAAILFAENLANRVSDAILNVCIMKDHYPNSNYSISIDIPNKLVDRYDYYIDFSNELVYVNSTNGQIQVSSTTFNAPNNIEMDISGRIYGSQQKLKMSCEKSNYIYKFDFGTNSSEVISDYAKITPICQKDENTDWHDNFGDWKYRSRIRINNPTKNPISDYQILIQLDNDNFGHYLANSDGSDIRFTDDTADGTGEVFYYWIERWYYPGEARTSRIWVNLSNVGVGNSTIYMYYGNENAGFDDYNDGDKTFLFFDDFERDSVGSNWVQYKSDSDDKIYMQDGKLCLENSSAVKAVFSRDSETNPYVIDVKAKAIGESYDSESKTGKYATGSEASMFARCYSGNSPPYYYSYVFSSNNFAPDTDAFLSEHSSDIITRSGGIWVDSQPNDPYPNENLEQVWNRLRFIVNGSDSVAIRYLYDTFSVDGYGSAGNSNSGSPESFGLCTLVPDSGAIAQYDWVFVHKFAADTTKGKRSEAEPMAYVESTTLVQNPNPFWTSAEISSGEDSNEKDFVWCDMQASFRLNNLDETTDDLKYSMTFTLGNKSSDFDGINITIEDAESSNTITIPVDDFTDYTNVWLSNIDVTDSGGDGLGDLEITFTDTAGDYYWSLDEMTLELSDRIIKVEGG